MKKLLFLFSSLLLFTSCEKETINNEPDEIVAISLKGKQDKVTVCHYDSFNDTWKTISINGNALNAHLEHGDCEGECSIFPTNGLVAWYPFNGNANDESGNNNNGMAMGNVVLENDRFGNPESSYYFPGQTDSYINVSQNATFSQFQEGLTLSLWARLISYNLNPRIIEIGNTDGQRRGFTMSANSSLKVWIGNIISANGTGLGVGGINEIEINAWEHLAVSFNFITGVSRTYVNGVLVSEGSPSPYVNNFGTLDLSDRIFNIGRKTESAFDPWEGSIDDIGIWNRVLTDEEIQYIYNN